jgi:serine/threonine protein kinase
LLGCGRRLQAQDAAARELPVLGERQCAIAHGIAMGMRALHSKGLVHCDLKPANVLLENVQVSCHRYLQS